MPQPHACMHGRLAWMPLCRAHACMQGMVFFEQGDLRAAYELFDKAASRVNVRTKVGMQRRTVLRAMQRTTGLHADRGGHMSAHAAQRCPCHLSRLLSN